MLVTVLAGLRRLPRLLEDHVAVEIVRGLVDRRIRTHSQGDSGTTKAVVRLLVDAMLPTGSPPASITLLERVPTMAPSCLAREGGSSIQEIMDTIC